MKLILAGGEILEQRVLGRCIGRRIEGFEIDAKDYHKVRFEREKFEQWLYEDVYTCFVPYTLSPWCPEDHKCAAHLILAWSMFKIRP